MGSVDSSRSPSAWRGARAERRRRLALALALLVIGGASACARSPGPAQSAHAPRALGRERIPETEDPVGMQLALAESLMREGTCFAALAHLDALAKSITRTPRAVWLRAECLRRTDRPAAAAELYRSLLGTDRGGQAHRGLGLIAARSGRLDLALEHLAQARDLLPADRRVRNDLGYALLLSGRVDEARVELSTAVELEEPSALLNLLLLLYSAEDVRAAEELLDAHAFDESVTRSIQEEAKRISRAWGPGAGRPESARGQPADAAPLGGVR